MLRAKKFSHIKKGEFYKFLKNISINPTDSTEEKCETIILYTYYIGFYYSNHFCYDFAKHKTFSSNGVDFHYTIQKELYTDTWMLVCDKLLLLYIDYEDIEEFCLSYMFSSIYRFIIYETSFGYIAVCISHTTDDVDDVLEFYIMNSSNYKYILLSYFLKNNNTDEDIDEQYKIYYETYKPENQFIDFGNKNIMYEYLPNISSFIILNQNVQTVLNDDCINDYDLYKLYDIIGYGDINNELNSFVKFIFKYPIVYKHYPLSYLPI